MQLLEVRDLTLRYGQLVAVNGLSFGVDDGDYLCIVGENGSGKSTVMKALLGLITPAAGEITYRGVRPGEIGYLPQQTAVQHDFPATVWEVALSGTLGQRKPFLPFYSADDRARAEAMLRQLKVYDLKNRSVRELSGGQRQRVLIARALCAAQRLLLLDEPAAALDPASAAQLYERIDHLNKKHGVTVIMITHSMEAARHGTKILHMAGKNTFFGESEEFFASGRAAKMIGGEDHV